MNCDHCGSTHSIHPVYGAPVCPRCADKPGADEVA